MVIFIGLQDWVMIGLGKINYFSFSINLINYMLELGLY